MAYQSCPDHGGPINLCPYAHVDEEHVGPSRPMRPWRWDAVAFKAVQVSARDEQMTMLAALQTLAIQQAAQSRQNDWSQLYGRQRPRPTDGFFSTLFGF